MPSQLDLVLCILVLFLTSSVGPAAAQSWKIRVLEPHAMSDAEYRADCVRIRPQQYDIPGHEVLEEANFVRIADWQIGVPKELLAQLGEAAPPNLTSALARQIVDGGELVKKRLPLLDLCWSTWRGWYGRSNCSQK